MSEYRYASELDRVNDALFSSIQTVIETDRRRGILLFLTSTRVVNAALEARGEPIKALAQPPFSLTLLERVSSHINLVCEYYALHKNLNDAGGFPQVSDPEAGALRLSSRLRDRWNPGLHKLGTLDDGMPWAKSHWMFYWLFTAADSNHQTSGELFLDFEFLIGLWKTNLMFPLDFDETRLTRRLVDDHFDEARRYLDRIARFDLSRFAGWPSIDAAEFKEALRFAGGQT